MSTIKPYLALTRPNFLLLVPICVFAGIASSYYIMNSINVTYLILALIGALLAHISANVLNNYFDYKSGIDSNTQKTPFSGGITVLTSGLLKSNRAFIFGIVSLLLVAAIGIYFVTIYKWAILPIGLCGIAIIYSYTPYLTKLPGLTELIGPGLGFGLMVLGVYFTQTGGYSPIAVIVTIVAGILIANLLFLNEFPDVHADKIGRRKHLPVILGRKTSAKIYSISTAIVYALIVGAVIAKILPLLALVSLATLPLSVKAIQGTLKYHSTIERLVPYMGINVLIVLLTPLLLSIGIVLDKVLFS